MYPDQHTVAQWNLEDRRDRFTARVCAALLVLMALGLALLALSAWAQAAPVAPPAPSWWSTAALKLLSADWVWNLFGVVGTLVAGKLLMFLHAKEGESKFAKVTAVVAEAAKAAVLQVEQELRPKVQSALADGVLTPAEGAELKAAAMAILRTKLPAGVLATAGTIFGPLLEAWLSKQVESANVLMPAELSAQAAAPAPAPVVAGPAAIALPFVQP